MPRYVLPVVALLIAVAGLGLWRAGTDLSHRGSFPTAPPARSDGNVRPAVPHTPLAHPERSGSVSASTSEFARGAQQFGAAPTRSAWIASTSVDAAERRRRFVATTGYRDLYDELSAMQDQLAPADLLLLRDVLLRCHAITHVDPMSQFIPAGLRAEAASPAPRPRAQAALRLGTACEGIPPRAFADDELSRLTNRLAGMQSMAYRAEVSWPAMAQSGNGRQAIAELGDALVTRDVSPMPAIASLLT